MRNGVAYDGTPMQAGTEPQAHQLTGTTPHFSIAGMREMVVIDRKFVDQPGNRSRSFVEYTCRDLYTGEVITGARRMQVRGGLDDGDDDVLQPASELLPGAKSTRFTRQTRAADVNGERVLVGFIEGARTRAVIIGSLTHSSSKYGATAADGDRRLTTHKNTRLEIKQDGSYNITRLNPAGETVTVVISTDGDVDVSGPPTRKVRFNYEGEDAIHLGTNTTDHLLKGETVQSIYNSFVALYNALVGLYNHHRHGTSQGPSGPPLDPAQSLFPNPWYRPAPPVIGDPALGCPWYSQQYVVDAGTIETSLATVWPLPSQPITPGANPTDEMPDAALSTIAKVQ